MFNLIENLNKSKFKTDVITKSKKIVKVIKSIIQVILTSLGKKYMYI